MLLGYPLSHCTACCFWLEISSGSGKYAEDGVCIAYGKYAEGVR